MSTVNYAKVAIITGAASGIGAGIALRFSALGINLSLTDINLDGLKDTKENCVKTALSGRQAIMVNVMDGDITNADFRSHFVRSTADNLGRVDILVNCAGIISYSSVLNVPVDEMRRIFEVNVIAATAMCQLCAPHLVNAKGNIVNVSSRSSTMSTAKFGYYCMSKAALDMLTKSLAQELGPHGVRVNSVNPGAVITPIQIIAKDVLFANEITMDAYRNVLADGTVLNTVGMPDDIANSVAFLASNEEARFITGHHLSIDGGLSIGKGTT